MITAFLAIAMTPPNCVPPAGVPDQDVCFLPFDGMTPDCTRLTDTVARGECQLAQAIANEPEVDCENNPTSIDRLYVCPYRDYLRADIELSRVWKALTGSVKGENITRDLFEGQSAWLKYRDAHCKSEGHWSRIATMEPMVTNCLIRLIIARTKELEDLLPHRNHQVSN